MSESNDLRFIGYLKSLVEHGDRATLATLRRGLGKEPGAALDAYPIVMRFVPENAGEREERLYFLVAALFAFHPRPPQESDKQRRNFGASLRILYERRDGVGVERRFAALLACYEAELGEHLRHAISLLKSDNVSVDWARLLSDLRWWNRVDRSIQRQWARAFWAGRAEAEDNAREVPLNSEQER